MSLMGYRSTLLRSVIALTVFYSLAGMVAFYAMGPEALQAWLEARGFWDAGRGDINPANAASAATAAVVARVDAVWPWLAGGMIMGTLIVLMVVLVGQIVRRYRAKARGEFRGMDLTITSMPTPDPVKFKPVKAQLAGSVPRHHLPLIRQLLGYLQAHPDAYCGDGHGTTLLEHHLGVMDQAFEYEGADPLLPLAAAAHDIGKTISHAKQDGEWVRLSPHDKEGARLLPKFPAWWELPENERAILLLAVKYEHSPSKMPRTYPGLTDKGLRRASTLLQQLREIDGLTTRTEKSKVLESLDVEELAIDAFLRVIPLVPYQVKGLAKGVKAAGFRVGDRLYLSEPMIREAALTKLGQGVAEALGGGYRAPGKTGQFTQILLKALHGRGWLVTEAEGVPDGSETSKTWTLPADQALWRVRSGIIEFRGMIAVELPEEHHGLYPRETAYEVTVIGPLRSSAGSGVVPTKDSGKREERAEIPKGVPASEVCEVSLFAGPGPGADVGKVEPSAAGGGAAQENEPVGGDVARKGGEDAGAGSPPGQGEPSKGDVSWLLDDGLDGDDSASTAPAGGYVAQKDEPAGGDVAQKDEPVGGDVAQKDEEAAGKAAAAPPNNDAAWLLEDEGGASTAPAGGDAAQEDKPVGGDVAQKDEEAAGKAAAAPPNNDAAWLLEDEGGASTAPAGGDAAQEDEPVGGDVAQKGGEDAGTAASPPPNNDAAWPLEDEGGTRTTPAGGAAAQKGEAKLSPIERRLQKRRAKAKKAGDSTPGSSAQQAGSDSDAGAKGKRAKAEVAGPPKLFS
ncbi:HD domain-containing protein [Halomonas cupida]|uniref:HD domain-containing protein n=1 Tax=Halomonas cupida TaxID=44933 RepID=UPI003EF64D64